MDASPLSRKKKMSDGIVSARQLGYNVAPDDTLGTHPVDIPVTDGKAGETDAEAGEADAEAGAQARLARAATIEHTGEGRGCPLPPRQHQRDLRPHSRHSGASGQLARLDPAVADP
jgi:hypothetical protein